MFRKSDPRSPGPPAREFVRPNIPKASRRNRRPTIRPLYMGSRFLTLCRFTHCEDRLEVKVVAGRVPKYRKSECCCIRALIITYTIFFFGGGGLLIIIVV